ncbi:MAG: DNA polymerase III subunit alpha [Bdellovibrionota bacterium]
MGRFVHLHLHTQYSVLDGAIKIDEVIQRAKDTGQHAVAITDHGVMHGAVEFYTAALAENIKPIVGCEMYITSGSRFDKTPKAQGGAQTHHLTLLAKNMAGYRNLCRLVTMGFTEGFYFKPRIDFELLEKYSDGLICLSGCMAGELALYSRNQDIEGASKLIERYATLFGERYYLEVQPHVFKEQQQHNRMLRELGDKIGIPLVATNDCHYLGPDDHYAQEVLMCISTGKLITDEDRLRHDESRLHFKTEEEMLGGMPGFEDAIGHTGGIADLCELQFDFKTHHMPRFDPENGEPVTEHFMGEARKGLEQRFEQFRKRAPKYLTPELERVYADRLELEIQLILKMGFAGYFLVVSDFIRWAKRNDIPVGPGRGSAAGSLVAFAMFITEIDPIPNKLLFERFLNPERISLPDIDIDFCIYGREKVIDYVCNKYGKDKVAQIVTFGTLKAKAAIKDVGRALGLSYAETDRIAKLIPAPRQGFDYPLEEAIKMEKRLREYAEGEGRELIELAMKLEGLSRHTSTHAAGIVIADRPIVEFIPLMLDKEEQIITQYSMSWVEKIGLVKFDFLGLKTLSVLHEAQRLIREATKTELELNALPLDDARTYKLVSLGRTIGVFQLESSGITEMVTRLKPSCFEDLVAILALYRPGPLDAGMVDHYINRKHGREAVRYSHPILEPILSDTYGIILYQEQIMQIARDMAGYSLAEADMLRRAMGKKKPEEMAKQREYFTTGAKKRNVPEAVATDVFDQMETFARYGFNRSHSVAYALISYQTAYLKAHYPRHFMAALMTFEMGDTDKTLKNINECRENNIEILPPDLNSGQVGFNVVQNKILFGLAAIKGVGAKAVERLIEIRDTGGPFKSFYDFCVRADASLLNRRTMEHFIKAGAFDWSGCPRAELMEILDDTLKRAQKEREKSASNQIDLFGSAAPGEGELRPRNGKRINEWPVNIRLAHEKEALGFYLSGHPLEKFRNELSGLGTVTIRDVQKAADGANVTVAGVMTLLKLKNTKKGDRYATFVLEDMLDTIEVIVWPDTYQKVQQALTAEDPVIVGARLDVNDDRRTLIANAIESAIARRDRNATEALIRLSIAKCSEDKLEELKSVLRQHQGECPVKLIFRRPDHSETTIALPVRVAPSESLSNRVEQLFGEPVVTFR